MIQQVMKLLKLYIIKKKFIDFSRFIAGSLLNLVDNATEEIYKIKCKD